MVNCSNCGFDAGDSKFCPNCGSEIIIEEPVNSCPNCGADVGESNFCPSCGTKIEKEPLKHFCPNCGADVGESNFCPSCGTKIEKEPLKHFCPGCGAEVGDNMFCPSCGTKINGEKQNTNVSLNQNSSQSNDLIDGVIDLDNKISGKLGGFFSKSKSMDKVLDKTASYRYKNISKAGNRGMDRAYFEKIEPVFLEVLDSIDDNYVKDILLFERSMMGSGGSVVGVVAAQVYTPTKDMSHDEALKFYHKMVNNIVREINEEKQKGTFDEEEFYKNKIKQSTLDNVSVIGIPKSVKSFRENQK